MSIERNFHKYLFNLVKASAMNNKVAKTVAMNYLRLNRSTKEKFFESLMPLYSNFTDTAFDNIKFEESVKPDFLKANKDFRLKSIRIANVRGIPESKNSLKYGFDLVYEGQIQNAVFLGPNGTGKSSLFNAVEFIYSHEVAENKLRVVNPENLGEKDYLKFLEHFNESPECEIETPSGKFSLRNRVFKTEEELKTIYPDTHFISDYDIYKKGQLNYLGKDDDLESFHHLIANSLGLQDYLDFTNLLKSLSTYGRAKESNDRKKLIGQRDALVLENKKNQEQIKIKTERINELKVTNSNSIDDDSNEKLAATLAAIKTNSYTFSFDKVEYLKVFDNYKTAHEQFIGLSVNRNLQTEAQFLALGLELINNSENCPFCEDSNLSVADIKKKIEKRILEIKEYEASSKTLDQCIRNLQFAIKDTLTRIQSIGRTLSSELNQITTINELGEVHQDGKDLIQLLANETNSLIEVDESISNIISSINVLSEKDNAIFNLIKGKEVMFLVDIANIPFIIEKFAALRLKAIAKIEETLARKQTTTTPKQQILILESEIKNHQTAILTSQQQINNLETEIEQLIKTIDTINEIKSQAGAFAKELSVSVNKLVTTSFEPIKETIITILSEYLKEENVSLQIRLDEGAASDDPESIITTIIAEIQRINTQTGEFEIHSPSKFFNTFRFRLFCTMVSISVVIAARKNAGINLPLVLDDIFYASDYNSKNTFRKFLLNVINIFRKFNSEMPFQFILFTHDELVFDSALDAIAEFENGKTQLPKEQIEDAEWKTSIQNRTIFARLFSAIDLEQIPTESQYGAFWDLSYKIPIQIEQILTEHQNG